MVTHPLRRLVTNVTDALSDREMESLKRWFDTVRDQTCSDTPTIEHPEWDEGSRVSGRVVGWLQRTPNGGIVNGTMYPPGLHALVRISDEETPGDLLGSQYAGEVVGWFLHSLDEGFGHEIPEEAGRYVLIQTDAASE